MENRRAGQDRLIIGISDVNSSWRMANISSGRRCGPSIAKPGNTRRNGFLQGASFLRTGIELGRETSRDSGNQIVFVEGGNSFLLRRRPYDNTFKRPQYSPDPSEPERSWPACAPGGTLWESGVDWTAGRAKGWAKFNGWVCAAFPPSPVPEPRG